MAHQAWAPARVDLRWWGDEDLVGVGRRAAGAATATPPFGRRCRRDERGGTPGQPRPGHPRGDVSRTSTAVTAAGRRESRVRRAGDGAAMGWTATLDRMTARCGQLLPAGRSQIGVVQEVGEPGANSSCSRWEATVCSATRWDPASSRASPLPAASSRRASPAVSPKVSVTRSMACGAWRIRIWVAALATTAWPRSLESRSAASWVITATPARRLRAAFASRYRNLAPSPSRSSVQASSTTTSGAEPAASGGDVDVAPDRIQREEHAGGAEFVGECRVDHTTRCRAEVWRWARRTGSGEASVHGASRAARLLAAGFSSLEGGGEVAQQRRGSGPGGGVVVDPGAL